MQLILRKNAFYGELGLYFWGFGGEADFGLKTLRAKAKYFQKAEEFSFRELGRSMHYFLGSKGA